MASELLLSCNCGAVRGTLRDVAPRTVNHLICHCDDCQAFAHAIGRADVLDEHGGTRIVQVSPASVEIGAGFEHLACLRLTADGMIRWYTTCCRMPVANLDASPRLVFVGLHRAFVDRAADGASAEAAIGPVRGRVQAKFATGDRSTLQADDFPVRMVVHAAWLLLRWWLRGDAARSPFRGEDGALRVAPRVLSADELHEAKAARSR